MKTGISSKSWGDKNRSICPHFINSAQQANPETRSWLPIKGNKIPRVGEGKIQDGPVAFVVAESKEVNKRQKDGNMSRWHRGQLERSHSVWFHKAEKDLHSESHKQARFIRNSLNTTWNKGVFRLWWLEGYHHSSSLLRNLPHFAGLANFESVTNE